jgi:hypothetical protein
MLGLLKEKKKRGALHRSALGWVNVALCCVFGEFDATSTSLFGVGFLERSGGSSAFHSGERLFDDAGRALNRLV